MSEDINFEEDAVEAAKIEVSDEHLKRLARLAKEQQDLEDELARLDEQVAEKKSRLDRVSTGEIPALMDEIGLKDFTLTDGCKVAVKKDVRASIKKENKPAAHKWLREVGADSLIKNKVSAEFGKGEDKKAAGVVALLEKKGVRVSQDESVHAQTLGAWVRDRIEQGLPVNAELLGVWEIRETKIVRPKK